jgi:hypothetical protein
MLEKSNMGCLLLLWHDTKWLSVDFIVISVVHSGVFHNVGWQNASWVPTWPPWLWPATISPGLCDFRGSSLSSSCCLVLYWQSLWNTGKAWWVVM